MTVMGHDDDPTPRVTTEQVERANAMGRGGGVMGRRAESEEDRLRRQLAGAVDAYLSELVVESRRICEREGVKNLAEWIGKTVLARVTGEGQ